MKTLKISEELHCFLSQIKAMQKLPTLEEAIWFIGSVENPYDKYDEKFMEKFKK